MSAPKHTIAVLALIIPLTILNSAGALEYTSFVFNIQNLIFFSYDANTALEIYESDGSSVIDFGGDPVLINDGNALGKGDHFELTSPYYLHSRGTLRAGVLAVTMRWTPMVWGRARSYIPMFHRINGLMKSSSFLHIRTVRR